MFLDQPAEDAAVLLRLTRCLAHIAGVFSKQLLDVAPLKGRDRVGARLPEARRWCHELIRRFRVR